MVAIRPAKVNALAHLICYARAFKNTAKDVMPTKRIQTVDTLINTGFAASEERPLLNEVAQHFAIGISQHVAQHIDRNDPDDPLSKQYVPTPQELDVQPEEQDDPIGDQPHTKAPGIIHRYPDRCLLTPIRVLCGVLSVLFPQRTYWPRQRDTHTRRIRPSHALPSGAPRDLGSDSDRW